MKILFEKQKLRNPKISIILLDWSCRQSFHTLDFLNKQTVPRNQYEILWIEYYARQAPEINAKLKKNKNSQEHPCVDKWIMMEMPQSVYYHKHLMYNIGIISSKGEIVTFCDSDTVVKPTFIEKIIGAFKKKKNMVLHMDEVRNVNKKYYPFDNQSIEDILGKGCMNYRRGKTLGILDEDDPLHTRNYGACMSALRKDLISIGGADEHIDYLGHICGPYEMTFRLRNAGKQEVWDADEFLFHTWHPGTDGRNNYLGPHDGKNMSTTALNIRHSKRIYPLLENKALEELRVTERNISYDQLVELAFTRFNLDASKIDLSKQKRMFTIKTAIKVSLKNIWIKILLGKVVLKMIKKQLLFKAKVHSGNKIIPKNLFAKCHFLCIFIRRMWRNNIYAIKVCNQVLQKLVTDGRTEIAVYGDGDVKDILRIIAKKYPIKLFSLKELGQYNGKVVLAFFTSIKQKTLELEKLGVFEENIIRLT